MARAVFRKLAIAFGAASIVAAAPAAGQIFSDSYEFLKAVKDREGDAVTKALDEPGSVIVNTRDLATGETALHIVTKRRDLTWVRFMLQKGANPNIRDKTGATPLQLATSLSFIEGVEALLKRGANVDDANSSGETPLIAAVHKRDIPMIRVLLANGADPDRTDNSGRTARDYVDLMSSNSLIVSEFAKADAERENAPKAQTYGPSF